MDPLVKRELDKGHWSQTGDTGFKLDRKAARKKFDGSNELFAACWRQYCNWLSGAIDNPKCQEDVDGWLDSIASEKVNDPESSFYIHG